MNILTHFTGSYSMFQLNFNFNQSFTHSFYELIFSRVLRDSTTHFVGSSVRRSLCPLFTFSAFLSFWVHSSFPNAIVSHSKSFLVILTPLTKLVELGSELVHNCFLKSKTGVQVNDDFKTCYSHEGSSKKLQILSTNSCKQLHQMLSCKVLVQFSFKFVAKTILFDKGCQYCFAVVIDCMLILLTHFCLLIQDPES